MGAILGRGKGLYAQDSRKGSKFSRAGTRREKEETRAEGGQRESLNLILNGFSELGARRQRRKEEGVQAVVKAQRGVEKGKGREKVNCTGSIVKEGK